MTAPRQRIARGRQPKASNERTRGGVVEPRERHLGLWRFNRGDGIGGKAQGRGGWLIVPADGSDRLGWSTRDDVSLEMRAWL